MHCAVQRERIDDEVVFFLGAELRNAQYDAIAVCVAVQWDRGSEGFDCDGGEDDGYGCGAGGPECAEVRSGPGGVAEDCVDAVAAAGV